MRKLFHAVVATTALLLTTVTAQSGSPKKGPVPTVALTGDAKLAHPVLRGKLGPFEGALVFFTQKASEDNSIFNGVVRVHRDDGSFTDYALPPPDEPADFFQFTIKSVLFQPTTRPPAANVLIVLYTAARIGPQQPTANAACVYAWDGKEFQRQATVEKALEGARTAKDARARLDKLSARQNP